MMNRIVRFDRIGGPDVLRIETVDPEPPQPGEVLLKVEAIGLNNSEAQLRRGDYGMMKADLPSRIGRECSGIVAALGAGVDTVRVGDAVSTVPAFEVKRNGVYGDWCVVPAAALTRVPPRLTRIEAAAVWQQYLTAYGPLVEYSQVGKGSVVLVTAAASSVGHGAIQTARALGATVIATTRTAAKRDGLLASGADAAFVGQSPSDLVPQILDFTGGRGFDVALDPVAGEGLKDLVAAATREARIFLYGQLAAQQTVLPLVEVLRKAIWLRGYTLWEITLDPVRRARAESFIYHHLEAGVLKPVIDRVFPLEQIAQAHAYLESGRQSGKIVVSVEGET